MSCRRLDSEKSRMRNQPMHTKMKQKISVTIDETTLQDILKTVESGKFRNKSHAVEYAVKKLLEEQDG